MAYVYRHIRLDKNVPFYIGIGTDNKYKRAQSKTGRNKLWHRIANVTPYEVEILVDDISIPEAEIKEIEFISLYGRINDGGTLSNITGGGGGNFNPSKEFREAISKRNLGNKYNLGKRLSSESKKKIGEAVKLRGGVTWTGRKHTEETKAKMSLAKSGRAIPEKQKKKISEFHRGHKYNLGKTHTEETKRKWSINRTGSKNANFKGAIQIFKDGVFVIEAFGLKECSKIVGVRTETISSIISGKKGSTRGYTFKRDK